jgi:hypothetical protein
MWLRKAVILIVIGVIFGWFYDWASPGHSCPTGVSVSDAAYCTAR